MIPVNFAVTGAEVLVRTTAYSEMAREFDDSPVAFQVDEFDASTRSGWSVLMRGAAHLESVPAGRGRAGRLAAGPRSMRLRIDVTQVTGRRLIPIRLSRPGHVLLVGGCLWRRSPPGSGW